MSKLVLFVLVAALGWYAWSTAQRVTEMQSRIDALSARVITLEKEVQTLRTGKPGTPGKPSASSLDAASKALEMLKRGDIDGATRTLSETARDVGAGATRTGSGVLKQLRETIDGLIHQHNGANSQRQGGKP